MPSSFLVCPIILFQHSLIVYFLTLAYMHQ
jgi:hypothetical protein